MVRAAVGRIGRPNTIVSLPLPPCRIVRASPAGPLPQSPSKRSSPPRPENLLRALVAEHVVVEARALDVLRC